MKKVWLFGVFLVLGLTFAQESSGFVEEDAHLHGAALLNIAQDAQMLFVEFISPSINIVGFEYQPSNEDEKTLVATALTDLENGMMLFAPSSSANCELISASVESEIAEDDHAHEEAKDEEHSEEEHADEHSDEHSEEHHDDEHAEEEHDEGEHDEEEHHDEDKDHDHENEEAETHSEFHGSYEFSCANAEGLAGLDLSGLFALYPNIADLDVQYALESGQGAAELNAENSNLDF